LSRSLIGFVKTTVVARERAIQEALLLFPVHLLRVFLRRTAHFTDVQADFDFATTAADLFCLV
jgi:hypothetical protein